MDVNRAGLTDLVTGGDGRFLLSSSVPEDLSVEVPLAIKRRGVEAKLVLTQGARHEPDEALIMLIANLIENAVKYGGHTQVTLRFAPGTRPARDPNLPSECSWARLPSA